VNENYGLNKYGTELMTHNGKNPIKDTHQEIGDLAAYIMQAKLEGHNEEEFERLKQMIQVILKLPVN